ncbi:hypothetical protein IWQ60_011750 [Tieghemiomyces parasiticus]|uniref:Kinetochore protein n=1 Tax=Tieghemiomyces parasiticus TaxID=78921 RepID=A0A9W8DL88_9FUNG|nr:hypothetical protein IWQ60_011750 [Tieghemiomyces parasiticus]
MNNAAAQDFQLARARFIGTGDAETTRYHWLVNQHRDTYASVVGHPNLLSLVAVTENESRARCRFNMLQLTLVSPNLPGIRPRLIFTYLDHRSFGPIRLPFVAMESNPQGVTRIGDFIDQQAPFLDQPFEIPTEFQEKEDAIPDLVLQGLTQRINVELRKRCLASINQQTRNQLLWQLKCREINDQAMVPVVPVTLPPAGDLGDKRAVQRYAQLRSRLARLQKSLRYMKDKHRHYEKLQALAATLDVPVMREHVKLQGGSYQAELGALQTTIGELSRILTRRSGDIVKILQSVDPADEETDIPDANQALLAMLQTDPQ